MKRTYSLKRLFINMTLFCVALGVVVAFPRIAVRLFLEFLVLLPAVAISAGLACFSKSPGKIAAAGLLGMLLGWLGAPRILANWEDVPSWWDLFLLDFDLRTFSSVIGAMVIGGIAFVVWGMRRTPQGCNDQLKR